LDRFITAAEQKQQYLPTLYEINAIASPKMNPHLADTRSDRLNVAKISKLNGVETSKNAGFPLIGPSRFPGIEPT